MNIIPLNQSITSRLRLQQADIKIEQRCGSPRRIHADRRKEERYGNVSERRNPDERRKPAEHVLSLVK